VAGSALAARKHRHGRECLRRATAFNAPRRAHEEICYVKRGPPGPVVGAAAYREEKLNPLPPGASQNPRVAHRHEPKGGFMSIRKFVLATILFATAVSAGAMTAQQEKMKTCNADATGKALKGDARSAFMKTCLSNAPAAPAAKPLTAQQEKMKTCNADAKTKALKGTDRDAFMKTCLSKG
jgi:psiF repeat